METYITLITAAKEADNPEAGFAAIESAGCKLVAFYMLMGQYDYMMIIEAPDAETAATALWESKKAAGDLESHFHTMRAFTVRPEA